jgi:hypothetical protein
MSICCVLSPTVKYRQEHLSKVRPMLVLKPAAHARGELKEVRLVLGREQPCANEQIDQD